MNKLSEEKKQEVLDAAKGAALDTYKATANKSLKWWERLLWIALAAIAAGASALLSGCGHSIALDGESARICKAGTCIVISMEQQQPNIPVKAIEGGK